MGAINTGDKKLTKIRSYPFSLLCVSEIRVQLGMHHIIICGINSLLLTHLILRISPHHSHHLRSHHHSVTPLTFHSRLIKLICRSFTNPFLHSHSYTFRTDFTVLEMYCIYGALALF